MSTKETVASVAKKAEAPAATINCLFHEAMLSYEKALESGIQLQEDSARHCKELLARIGTPEALQEKLDTLSANLYPNARKALKEYIETVTVGVMFANQAGGQALDLFGKSLGIYQATSVADAQRRAREVVEEALTIGRENIRTILNTNLRIIAFVNDLAQSNPVKTLCATA